MRSGKRYPASKNRANKRFQPTIVPHAAEAYVVENITINSIPQKAAFVTAKRVKIEDGKIYRYRQA